MKKNLRNSLIGSSCLALLSGTVALGQQSLSNQPSAKTTARFISTLELDDNYDLRSDSLGNALLWTNTVGASLTDNTRTDKLFLDAQGSYRFSDLPTIGQSSTFDDPRLALDYVREIDDNLLEFSANYRRVDNNFFDPLGDINPDGSFDDGSGDAIRETFGFRAGVLINDDGPVSFEFDGDYRERNYYENESADLSDEQRYYGRTELGFRINRLVRLTIGTSYTFRDTESESGTDREIRRVDTGMDLQVNERLTTKIRLGYTEAERRRNSDGEKTKEEGFVGDISFVAEVPNGEVRGGLAADLDENGPRSTATIGRLITFANGELDADIGVSASDATDIRPVGGISYRHILPASEFNFGLNQYATVDDESRDVVNTNMNLSYFHRLTPVSSFNVSVLGGLTRYENSEREDTERVTAVASYNHALTKDWSADIGIKHRTYSSQDDSFASSNSIALTLRRDWEALK